VIPLPWGPMDGSGSALTLGRRGAQAGDQRLQCPQPRCERCRLPGVGNADLRDERGKETLDREQVLADIQQPVAAAGAGQRLHFAKQQRQCIDVPTLVAQALAALAQHLQALGQMTQERQAQFRRLLGVVLLLHCSPEPPLRAR